MTTGEVKEAGYDSITSATITPIRELPDNASLVKQLTQNRRWLGIINRGFLVRNYGITGWKSPF